MADLDNFDAAKALAESIGITVEKSWGLGRIVTEIFDEVAEAHLIQPTFITEYPAEVSPLARRNDVNPKSPTVLNSSSVVVKSVMVLAN